MKWVIRGLAIVIDGLQILLMITFFALQVLTPAGGAIAGAGAGTAACFNSGGNIINTIGCAAAGGVFGYTASALAIPIGIALDFTLSVTLGTALLLLLLFNGMFYPKLIFVFFGVEVLPFVYLFPGWTGLAWASTRKKEKDKKRRAAKQQEENEGSEEPQAANDNFVPVQQKSAA